MLKNTIDAQERYQAFIQAVAQSGLVYTLVNERESALSTSMHFVDEDGAELPVLCFWSSEQKAQVCCAEDWVGFQVQTIHLPEFIQNWCVDMQEEQIIAGLDFDQRLFGPEKQPEILQQDLLAALA